MCAARKAKDPRAVEFGHRSWRVRKQRADTGKRARPMPKSSVEIEKLPTPDSGASNSLRKTVRPSISRAGGPARDKGGPARDAGGPARDIPAAHPQAPSAMDGTAAEGARQ
jgi:hypothetical protein